MSIAVKLAVEMEQEQVIRLTQFSRGAGCGCKIAPAVLKEIIRSTTPAVAYSQLLVGNETSDDAAVYDMGNGKAMIATTDFFMPIVDDAYDFGRIAAANAISDVYAMGGSPMLALAILGWPIEKLPPELAGRVLEGARAICQEAGIPLAGGHSIDSLEPFFGLSVTGMVELAHLKQNNTAQPGDILLLTKPLGTGVLATAQKRGVLEALHLEALLSSMTALNTPGIALGACEDVTAMTDVTGFGLAGHLLEMAQSENLAVTVYYDALPVISGAREYLKQRIIPDATYRNWNSYGTKIHFEPGVDVMEAFNLLPDPQTNGGLLVAARPDGLEKVKAILLAAGCYSEPIGEFTAGADKKITVRPGKA